MSQSPEGRESGWIVPATSARNTADQSTRCVAVAPLAKVYTVWNPVSVKLSTESEPLTVRVPFCVKERVLPVAESCAENPKSVYLVSRAWSVWVGEGSRKSMVPVMVRVWPANPNTHPEKSSRTESGTASESELAGLAGVRLTHTSGDAGAVPAKEPLAPTENVAPSIIASASADTTSATESACRRVTAWGGGTMMWSFEQAAMASAAAAAASPATRPRPVVRCIVRTLLERDAWSGKNRGAGVRRAAPASVKSATPAARTRASVSACTREPLEARRHRGPRSRLLVLEEDEGIGPLLGRDPGHPALERGVVVVLPPEPEVTPIRGRHRGGLGTLVVVGEHQRRVGRPERVVDVLSVPGLVPEFEGRAPALGDERQKIGQARQVLFHVGRELKERGPALFAEQGRRFQEVLELAPHVLQPFEVGDLLRGLENEAELRSHLLRPRGHHRFLRHPVKGVVDLHGAELGGVEAQHFVRRDFLRIEVALPFLVGVARGADVEGHDSPERRR